MALLDHYQFQLPPVDPLVGCDPDPTTDVGVVAGNKEEGVVKGSLVSIIVDHHPEGRLGEEDPNRLVDVGKGAEVVAVQEGLGPGMVGGVDNRRVETNSEVVEEDPLALAAEIMVVADVDPVGALVGKNLVQA